jgi:hypothetical protein
LLVVSLNPASVTGGTSSTGTVVLNAAAPAGGAAVALTSSNSMGATVPANVTVAAGQTTATFQINTTPVTVSTSVTISGAYNGSASAILTVGVTGTTTAVALSFVSLSPSSVIGGTPSTGTVALNTAAPAGGVTVTLTSSNTTVATVPASVAVAAGQTTAMFQINTTVVTVSTPVTISGDYNGSANAILTATGTTTTSNVQAITVNTGPSAALGEPYVDGAFTSVTVCVPGSTTNCQTISGILVDSGSSGLRILSSALTVALPQQTDSGGHPIAECAAFSDGITWGPVQTADVKMAGEQAGSLPIQVIGSPNFTTVPGDCSNQGVPEDDLSTLGANGILGLSQSIQDCGTYCSTSGPASLGAYYSCSSSGCTDTTESLAQQVQNPVASFTTDNNGVIIELPAVTGAEASVSGSLIFGIGTQADNGLGSATVFGTDQYGDLNYTTYQGQQYQGFMDSGSNGIYFLDSTTTGIPVCNDATFWYCPSSTQNIAVLNAGTNGANATLGFTVGNADTLTMNLNNAAVNGLAGPNPGTFDFGLPFFFGRNVYMAIEGRSTPGGTGPYLAY